MRLQLHQTMIADEEYKALKAECDRRAQQLSQHSTQDRSVCLLASISRQHNSHAAADADDNVAGTLDLYAVKSVQGEVLIGKNYNAASTEQNLELCNYCRCSISSSCSCCELLCVLITNA